MSATTAMSPPSTEASPAAQPTWYSHPYNRAGLYRLATALGWLPRPARLALARSLGRLAVHLLPVERAVIASTLGRITGAEGAALDRLTRRVFSDFAMCFSDLVSTNRRRPARFLRYVATAHGTHWLDGMDGPVISLTAHIGNWELAGRLLARRSARQTHVVVADNEARQLERWVRRSGEGVRFVPRSRPTTSLALVAALRRGEVVALQGDRALGTRGDVLVPFFGCPAPFPLGPFVLARASGVPVVPAFCLLDSTRRYAVTVAEPVAVARGEEEDALRRWVGLLEEVVGRHPTQWFNFFDIWHPFGA